MDIITISGDKHAVHLALVQRLRAQAAEVRGWRRGWTKLRSRRAACPTNGR